ncbi:MAG: hypothetical protein ACFHHU_00110 [Porticoccaceae bacterium]
MTIQPISILLAAATLSACANYPDAAPPPTDQAKLATIELKPSMEQAYLIDDFKNAKELSASPSTGSALDVAALATDGATSLVLLAMAVANGDNSQDVVSKYALPQSIDGTTIGTLQDVNRYVASSTIEVAARHGFEVILHSDDDKVLLFKEGTAAPMYLRVYNFGAKAVELAPDHVRYAWGFTPAWVARKPASFNVCWGRELPIDENGAFETGLASDGRQIPLVDCERTVPDNISAFLRDLSGTGHFVYANKSVRVNRLYFKGNEYNPYW